MQLADFFRINAHTALGFSGGVDSSYLLYASLQYGADIQPYYVRSAFQPQFEYEDALRLCSQLGAKLKTIELDILACQKVIQNSEERCYYCKRAIFTTLQSAALADGYTLLIDGSNASDDPATRPGMRALQELDVRSPLREAGLSKADIRSLSKKAGLFTWDKPAYSCLATRISTNETIKLDDLQRVEAAEAALVALGFSNLRVRIFHNAARLQVPGDQLERVGAEAAQVRQALAPYFDLILLDLHGR